MIRKIVSEDDFRAFVAARPWTLAATMPQWPHSYTARLKGEPDPWFDSAVEFIRNFGEKRKFKHTGSRLIYLDIDGMQHWTMGWPVRSTILINRTSLDWESRLAAGEDPMSIAMTAST